jgi:MoaA/NifB/PqqE/SkfB family radical SAM enzyme
MEIEEYKRLQQVLKRHLGYNEMVALSADIGLPIAPPIRASLRVTSRCNSDCVYCPYRRSLTRNRIDLPKETLFRAIDTMADLGVRLLFLSGGEPLLRDDLAQICAHAYGRGMRVQLSTNGLLLVYEVAQSLNEAGLSELIMSLDSLEEKSYSIHRGVQNVRILETLDVLSRFSDFRVENSSSVTFVVSRKNYHELPGFIRFIEDFSDGRIGINIQPFHDSQHTKERDLLLSSEDESKLKKIMEEVVALKQSGSRINVSEDYLRGVSDYLIHGRMPEGPCWVGYFGMYVQENLDVLPCWKMPSVGNLTFMSATDLWLSPEYAKARNQMTHKECSRCMFLCNQSIPDWFEILYKTDLKHKDNE